MQDIIEKITHYLSNIATHQSAQAIAEGIEESRPDVVMALCKMPASKVFDLQEGERVTLYKLADPSEIDELKDLVVQPKGSLAAEHKSTKPAATVKTTGKASQKTAAAKSRESKTEKNTARSGSAKKTGGKDDVASAWMTAHQSVKQKKTTKTASAKGIAAKSQKQTETSANDAKKGKKTDSNPLTARLQVLIDSAIAIEEAEKNLSSDTTIMNAAVNSVIETIETADAIAVDGSIDKEDETVKARPEPKVVMMLETSDRMLFNTREQAVLHEDEIHLLSGIDEYLNQSNFHTNTFRIHRALLLKWEHFKANLLKNKSGQYK